MPINNSRNDRIRISDLIRKLWVFLLLGVVLILTGSIVYSAGLEVFVNSYEADKNRAFIQIQNSGSMDLTDVYYSIDNLAKEKLVDALSPKTSNIIVKALSAGEHIVKVKTKEGVSVEQKIVLGRTEQQIARESQAQDKNAPLTAAQIENSQEAQEEIKATQIGSDIQIAALRQIQQENTNTLEQELKNAEDKQQKLFDAERQEREALKQKSIDAKLAGLAAGQKSAAGQQLTEQKKEFPATKEKDNLAFNVSIGVLLIVGIIFVYYMFKKNE